MSQGCQPSSTGAAQADIILNRSAFAFAVAIYADPGCKAKLFTITTGGTYQLRSPSSEAKGAQTASSRQVTPHAQPIADAMTAAACGRVPSRVGFATDILATGCAPLNQPSEQACPVEYELLKRTDDRLSLGERPADGLGLCSPERQATQLGTALIQN